MVEGAMTAAGTAEDCARALRLVTRHWAALDASGPRAGPVREAIGALEPVIFAQMILALDRWRLVCREAAPEGRPEGPATARLRQLAAEIIAGPGPGRAAGPPRVSSIDFVMLWPEVLKELGR